VPSQVSQRVITLTDAVLKRFSSCTFSHLFISDRFLFIISAVQPPGNFAFCKDRANSRVIHWPKQCATPLHFLLLPQHLLLPMFVASNVQQCRRSSLSVLIA
jgi:hypothetical protein